MNTATGIFERVFGTPAECLAFAPGRVNLIGEHIDYAGGAALPMAIDRGVTVAAAAAPGAACEFHAAAFEETLSWRMDATLPEGWARYVAGVLTSLFAETLIPRIPVRLAITADLPIGAGVSSSAALTVAVAKACAELTRARIDAASVVRACSAAERLAGVACGAMDFMASMMGVSGHALRIDFHETPTVVPIRMFPESSVRVVLINSHVHRRLSDGRYGTLREAADEMARHLGASFARADGGRALDASVPLSPAARRSLDHARSEMSRTDLAERALRGNDPAGFGAMMRESHDSLSRGLGVSCPELDFLAEHLNSTPGVFGARMMGGGFGGGVIVLLESQPADEILARTARAYAARFAADCTPIPIRASGGAWARRLDSVDSCS